MKDVDPSYQYLSHEGSCGTCSSLQDLTVYLKNPDLSSVGIQCGFQAIQDVQAGIDCFMEVGFTEACAAIWTYNTLATSAECGDLCVPFATEGEPNNGPPPTCALAECLQCDEDKVGPTFKEFAGRTRRNSGLLSAIARPCDTIASIQHMDPCLPNQAKPPAELIGEGIGDGKSASVLYGFCAKGILSADGSIEMTLNSGGFCGQVDVEQIPTRKLFDGETAISSVTGWECMECTGTYDVFGLKDGTGYSEKFENHEEMKTSCGKLTVEFDGMGGTQCILFKTSLLKESLTTRRNLRNKNLELDVSGYLLVNTLTFGPRTPTGDPSCPADIVFDRNQFKWVENAALTLQLVMQEPGTLIDPSNWECNSSQ